VYDKFRNINCLKLVATKLAAKTFLKGVSGVPQKWLTSTTCEAQCLTDLAKELWI